MKGKGFLALTQCLSLIYLGWTRQADAYPYSQKHAFCTDYAINRVSIFSSTRTYDMQRNYDFCMPNANHLIKEFQEEEKKKRELRRQESIKREIQRRKDEEKYRVKRETEKQRAEEEKRRQKAIRTEQERLKKEKEEKIRIRIQEEEEAFKSDLENQMQLFFD